MRGLDGKTWYDTATLRIDLLKKVEDRIVSDLGELAGGIHAEATKSLLLLAGIGALTLIFCSAITFIIARDIAVPMKALTGGMRELAEGNFDVTLPGVGRKDEIGDIAGAVDAFKIKLEEKMRLDAEKEQEVARREQAARDEHVRKEAEAAQIVAGVVASLGTGLEKLANGDLTYRLNEEFIDEYKKVQDDFNGAIEQLQRTIKNITMSSAEISNAAAEISTSTTDLSQRTEEQAASLEETSASMEQIAATVRKNAENARHANQLAQETCAVADRGGSVVSQAVAAMARIEESSSQDFRHHFGDRRNRASDQSAGAQRRGRSSAGGRSGPRLCRGCLGSPQPGAALVASGQGHYRPDRRQRRSGQGRRRTRQPRGCVAR